MKEFRVDDVSEYKVGQEIDTGIFDEISFLDVSGVTIGKGFQGVIKRHHFSGGPGGHGSHFHRAPGSIGNCSDPSRVFKGKKMPGRMGGAQRTIKNLRVVNVDKENNLLLIKGSIPGNKKEIVYLNKSVKNK